MPRAKPAGAREVWKVPRRIAPRPHDPDSSCATGGHSSPRREIACGGNEAQVGRKPEYFLLPVKSILNRCDSERVPFEWTVNPYRGCEFACKYCYARYTHEYMEIDGGEFEKKIFVKQDATALLQRDVSAKYSYESKASGSRRRSILRLGRRRIRTSLRKRNMV